MIQQFAGRTAVITGAGSGFGLEASRIAAREGMKLVMADVQADALERAVAEIEALGAEVLPFRLDVAQAAEVEALGAATLARSLDDGDALTALAHLVAAASQATTLADAMPTLVRARASRGCRSLAQHLQRLFGAPGAARPDASSSAVMYPASSSSCSTRASHFS